MKLDDLLITGDRKNLQTVVIPMAENEEIIGCIGDALTHDRAGFILIGSEYKTRAMAEKHNVSLSGAVFEEEDSEQRACERAAALCASGRAQVLMKGLVQTSVLTRAILNKEHGLIEQGSLISHTALFEIPGYDRLLILTDAAVNIAPGEDEKALIMQNAVILARKIGLDRPGIILLSAVEKITDKMISTVHAKNLTERAASGEFGKILVEGPLAFDAAVSAEAARIKGIESRLAGKPDILVAPNIESANILYKCLTQWMKARVAGVLAGVKVPVVLTSRSDSEETKQLSLALGLFLANEKI